MGIMDIQALTNEGVLGVQSTGTDFSGHMRKMIDEKGFECTAWLKTPGTRLMLIGWRKVVRKRGSKVKVYKPRIHMFSLQDFYSVQGSESDPHGHQQSSPETPEAE